MVIQVPVSKIDFGKNDGKNEAEKDNFFELFYDGNENYEKLNRDNYYLITGSKGSGKTLLANYFAKNKEKNKNCVVDTLYAVDFIEEKLLSFSKSPIAKEELTIFWKYVYLRNIGKLICKKIYGLPFYKLKRFKKFRIKKLEELLNEIQLIVESAEFSNYFEECNNMSGSVGGKGGKFGLNNAEKNSETNKNQMKKKKYYELISELEKEIIKCVKLKDEIYVIYDDLDQLEEEMDLKDFIDLMKSMIYAADNLNAKFRKKKLNIRILHVVRSDIKEMLFEDSNNIQKAFSDYGVNIDWFSKRMGKPYNHPIMKMLLHKIRNSVKEYSDYDDKTLYKNVFDEDEPILDFVLTHSFGRPREIIEFMLIYQEKFPNLTTIRLSNLVECLPIFSEWLYGAVLGEIKIQENSDDVKQLLALIKERGFKNFTYQKLFYFMNNNSKIYVDNMLETLQIMYKLGLVGLRNKNGTSEFHFRSNVNSLPRDYSKFIVHYGLCKYLNLM